LLCYPVGQRKTKARQAYNARKGASSDIAERSTVTAILLMICTVRYTQANKRHLGTYFNY
jgi:hypothetical protein